ncbi:uncharacterized protein LOC110841687 [Folsomia candida]|uniref:Layilin n=1 Tax=Folsomia candida TaxID=158441 RepID=A0A226EXA9_FOLCA|nr:uncharacterized protein LOC110841687 [Folsomia candida]OXA61471.1 Layilin [Folsomia candida]
MIFTNICAYLIVQFCILAVSSTPLKGHGRQFEEPINNFTSFGSVDGKEYFYDRTQAATWYQARSNCKAAGMQIATIDTQSQLALLKYKFNPPNLALTGIYWIGAREARTIDQFKWDSTGGSISSVGETWVMSAIPEYCVYINYGGNYHGRWETRSCDTPYYQLCEKLA